MTIEQQQLDDLEQLSGKVGHAWDLAHEVEAIGFEAREDDETGDALIVLQGVWLPDGSDAIVGKIICGEENSRIVCGEEN